MTADRIRKIPDGPGKNAGVTFLGRRSWLLGAATLIASGCSRVPIVQATAEGLRTAWAGVPDVPITREQVAALPYASLRVRFGKGPRSLLVLGRYAGEELQWVSADRGVVATRHGRVVRTVGFPQDLTATRDLDPDPLSTGLHRVLDPVTYRRVIDLASQRQYQVRVESVLRPAERAEIEILGLRYETVRYVEQGSAEGLGWSFENEFWADAHGFAWRSIQHFSPGMPPLEIEVLKPAS